MTNHPITPPPELVQEWAKDWAMLEEPALLPSYLTTRAAQWGADQELEACVQWTIDTPAYEMTPGVLRAARRPQPQTLNSIALQMLGTIERDAHYLPEITDTIRRALEALPND